MLGQDPVNSTDGSAAAAAAGGGAAGGAASGAVGASSACAAASTSTSVPSGAASLIRALRLSLISRASVSNGVTNGHAARPHAAGASRGESDVDFHGWRVWLRLRWAQALRAEAVADAEQAAERLQQCEALLVAYGRSAYGRSAYGRSAYGRSAHRQAAERADGARDSSGSLQTFEEDQARSSDKAGAEAEAEVEAGADAATVRSDGASAVLHDRFSTSPLGACD
eukprot:1931038-Pleurochrysis_carterae.AAC.1